jgi:hypothetical protein
MLVLSSSTILACVAVVSQTHAQQSFGFGFSSSSSFSSSSQSSNQAKSPGEDSSSSYPSSTNNGFRLGNSKSITNVNGHIVEKSLEDRDGKKVATTRILNGKQEVFIEEADDWGIQVTVKENVRGKEKKSQFKADSRKALRKKHPAAFEWVRKYASDSNNTNVGAGPNNFGGGAFTGPDAHEMMKKQIEQMIQQTEDPNFKQQLRSVLEQIQNNPIGLDR